MTIFTVNHKANAGAAAEAVRDDILARVASLQNTIFGSSIAKSRWPKQTFMPDFSPNAIDDRQPLPFFHLILLFIVVAGTCMIPGKLTRVACTLPIVVLLVASRPMLTAGTPWDDYNTAAVVFVLLLAYLDFWIITPLMGEELKLIGETRPSAKAKAKVKEIGEGDCKTWREKILWSLQLHTSPRGVNWNWATGTLTWHRYFDVRHYSIDKYAIRCALISASMWSCGRLALYVLGACKTLQYQEWSVGHWFYSPFLVAAVGWCGLFWMYSTFLSAYWGLAALTVALKICKKDDWPNLFGALEDAWSVRQAWGEVWHQCLRRRFERISIPLARLIGLRKGTFGSRYVQLFMAFAITTLMYEWSVLCSSRRDSGEFMFVMSQPVIIALEDLVQYGYRKVSPEHKSDGMIDMERYVGYAWTFLWFSYCLGPLVQGLLDEQQIPGGDWLAEYPMVIGSRHAFLALQGQSKLIMTKTGWSYYQ